MTSRVVLSWRASFYVIASDRRERGNLGGEKGVSLRAERGNLGGEEGVSLRAERGNLGGGMFLWILVICSCLEFRY